MFDVDRKDWLEKLASVGKAALDTIVDLTKSVAGGAFKSIGEEAAAGLGRRMSTGDDDVLICDSAEFENYEWNVSRGEYELVFQAKKVEEGASDA